MFVCKILIYIMVKKDYIACPMIYSKLFGDFFEGSAEAPFLIPISRKVKVRTKFSNIFLGALKDENFSSDHTTQILT